MTKSPVFLLLYLTVLPKGEECRMQNAECKMQNGAVAEDI